MESFPHLSGLEISTKKSESTTNFQQLNHECSDPKFKFVASQKLALNTSKKGLTLPNLNESRHLPSSSEKKKKSPKLRVLPGWKIFQRTQPQQPTPGPHPDSVPVVVAAPTLKERICFVSWLRLQHPFKRFKT